MNILSTVAAFLILASFCAYSISHSAIASIAQKQSYKSYLQLQRDFFTKLAKKNYEAVEDIEKKGKKKEGSINPDAVYRSPREKPNVHSMGKLNIALLFEKKASSVHTLLYDTSARLLKALYGRTRIYKPNLEYEVLDFLISSAKKAEGSIESFEDFFKYISPKDKHLYKILKGTPTYTLYTSNGYPSLSEYLVIDSNSKRKPIVMIYASKPLLVAFFGEEITRKIQEREKIKWEVKHKLNPITKKELEVLPSIIAAGQKLDPAMLDFSRNTRANTNLLFNDPKSGISLKKSTLSK